MARLQLTQRQWVASLQAQQKRVRFVYKARGRRDGIWDLNTKLRPLYAMKYLYDEST